jgi:integrase
MEDAAEYGVRRKADEVGQPIYCLHAIPGSGELGSSRHRLKFGRLPWAADSLNRAFLKAGKASGVGHVSTHTMRHTCRSWLDAVGAPIAVQQRLMRHADIRTTMNVYGDVVTD